LNTALPLGHGTVLSNPDKPFLVWAYTNGLGERITRNNPDDFLEAAEHMCRAMQCFQAGDPDFNAPGIPSNDYNVIQHMLREIKQDDSAERHKTWTYQIEQGAFSFGKESLTYIPEGEGSWKHHALGVDTERPAFRYEFLKSDWKLFHDALQAHRFDVVHNILPAYGICAG
jgi:hypothetical protein